MQAHISLAIGHHRLLQQAVDDHKENPRKLFGRRRDRQSNPARRESLAQADVLRVVFVPKTDRMIESIDHILDRAFHQAKVIHHLPLIKSVRFQQDFHLVAVAMDRSAATQRRAVAHDMRVFKTEQFANQHKI